MTHFSVATVAKPSELPTPARSSSSSKSLGVFLMIVGGLVFCLSLYGIINIAITSHDATFTWSNSHTAQLICSITGFYVGIVCVLATAGSVFNC